MLRTVQAGTALHSHCSGLHIHHSGYSHCSGLLIHHSGYSHVCSGLKLEIEFAEVTVKVRVSGHEQARTTTPANFFLQNQLLYHRVHNRVTSADLLKFRDALMKSNVETESRPRLSLIYAKQTIDKRHAPSAGPTKQRQESRVLAMTSSDKDVLLCSTPLTCLTLKLLNYKTDRESH